MYIDFAVVQSLHQKTKRRAGFLEYQCSALGIFDDLDQQLNQRFKPQIIQQARKREEHRPGLIGGIIKAVGGDWGAGVGSSHSTRRCELFWENAKVLGSQAIFRRAVADLDEKELSLLAASSAHVIALWPNEAQRDDLLHFLYGINARLVWAGGQTQYVQSTEAQRFPAEAAAAEEMMRGLLAHYINADLASYHQDVATFLAEFAQGANSASYHQLQPEAAAAVRTALQQGSACWASAVDIYAPHSPFKRFESGEDLFLGVMQTPEGGIPIGFGGNESLVTVAQPGAGKTQCHVVPNLLTYTGPLVVLDPKLELLELTGGFRQLEGVPIYVLNLADDDVPTHRFNIMEFIDRRPEFLWNALTEIAEFLLPAASGDTSPIFRNKAAELFAVCLGGELLEAIEAERHPTLTKAISRIFTSHELLSSWLADTADRAAAYGCEPLEQSAMGFAALLNNPNTIEDFQRYQSNATSALTKYRGGVIDRVANGSGDWTPEDVRAKNATLYIRIPYEEMSLYGGFIRLVLYTLIKRLRRGKLESGNLPMTFLLDEVAQLGDLDQIANVIETGRGAGLRVWMILQDYDQAKSASSKPNLILRTPKVRLFMNPTLETAKDVSEELGKINQILTGKEKPLAEPFELLGEGYANSIVVLSSGAKPLHLTKYFAWQDESYQDQTSKHYQFSEAKINEENE